MKAKSISDKVVEYILTLDPAGLKDLTVNSIAGEFNVHRSYISRKFKLDKKKFLSDYIRQVKIIRAARVLEESNDIDTQALAALMGYENIDYFRRIFKEILGTSPEKYRKYIKKRQNP